MKKILISLLIFLLAINLFIVYSFGSVSFDVKLSNDQTQKFVLNDSLTTPNYFYIFYYGSGSTLHYFIYVACDEELFLDAKNHLFLYNHNKTSFNYRYFDLTCYSNTIDVAISKFKDTDFNSLDLKSDTFFASSTVSNGVCVYSNTNLKDTSGNIISKAPLRFPYFINTDEDFATGNFDVVLIDGGDFNTYNSPDINFVVRKTISKSNGDIEYDSNEIFYHTVLNSNSKYFYDGYVYMIPQEVLGIDFDNSSRYVFSLEYEYNRRIYNR